MEIDEINLLNKFFHPEVKKVKKVKRPIRQYQTSTFNEESILFKVIYCNA